MAKRTPRVAKSETEVADDIASQSGMPATKKSSAVAYEPIYRMTTDSAIPVSKHEGSVWKSRMDNGIKVVEKPRQAWQEALKYFNNDQMNHRISSNGDYSGNIIGAQKLTRTNTETENIVFSNVTTLTDLLYAKNPTVEVTTQSAELKEFSKVLKDLLNVLAWKPESAGGIALKGKAKQCVTLCELTNNAWIKVWWVAKEDSSQQAMEDYKRLVSELASVKSTKELMEKEAHILAMEEAVAITKPSGLEVSVYTPFQVIVDPTSKHPDPREDANWMIVLDYLPTDYINCTYGEKEEDGRYKSTYKPSHYLSTKAAETDPASIINNFSIMKEDGQMQWQEMGFSSMEAYQKACYTEVAMVFDKIKKRVLMFATNDWSWPIWVWDDTQNILGFFPMHKLSFYVAPLGGQTKGEVTYYLDQQDGINEINDESRRSRDWMKRNILYNERHIKREAVEDYLKGNDGTARGVTLPEGVKWEEVVWSAPPPSFKFYEIFMDQKKDKLDAINRISSMNDVMSGVQFKTNTTNKAIDNYNQSASIRTDGRTDMIEDWLGQVFWSIAQLCMMNMTAQDVSKILNRDVAENWKQISDPAEMMNLQIQVVGGSTKKPNSAQKKQEAVQVSQALGQFANAAPPVVLTMLQVLENAFDEIVITDDDWNQVEEHLKASLGVGGPPQGDGTEGGASGGNIDQVIAQLPPAIQQAVKAAIDKGVPPEVALQEVQKRASQQQGGQ